MQETTNHHFKLIDTSDVFGPEALNDNARAMEAALDALSNAYAAADAALADAYAAADAALSSAYAAADAALDKKITDLTKAYAAADATLDGKITALSNAYTAADATLDGKIAAQAKAYAAADTTLDGKIAALSKAVGSGGRNARVAVGTFVGTGGTRTYTFDFCPVLLAVSVGAREPTVLARGHKYGIESGSSIMHQITWGDYSISVSASLNSQGIQYPYIVIGYDPKS